MGKVVFSGHGGFETSTDPPMVTVPENTEIHFYTENLKALLDSIGGDVESMSPAFDAAQPSQSVYAGQPIWNYTLYDPEDLNIQDSPPDVDQIVLSGGSMTLGQLFDYGIRGQCHWAACRVVDLDPAGGALLGVNAAQTDFGNEGGDVGSSISGNEVDTANQWLQWFWSADEDAQVAAFDDLPSGYKRIYCDYSPDLATWARQRSYIV
jgi:hypothetical protein